MTSQGTAHGRFARAIRRGHLNAAEMAAREMGGLSLGDALKLALLIAEAEPQRWPRTAARLHARLVTEAPRIGVRESTLALAAIDALVGPFREPAAETLRELARAHGLRGSNPSSPDPGGAFEAEIAHYPAVAVVDWNQLLSDARANPPLVTVAHTFVKKWSTASQPVLVQCDNGNEYVVKGVQEAACA